MFKFYIGIAFGAAAVYLGYKQIKAAKSSPQKILGIIAVVAGVLGVMAGIGSVLLKK
jgi:hypothetical protein